MTRGEHELPWLGTRRFWALFGAILVLGLLLCLKRSRAVASPRAVVPVVSLAGPAKAKPGGTARYAVLVRDRRGSAVANARVRVGFWKTSLVEIGRGTTGESGDAAIEVSLPSDFAERRALVAVAATDDAEGETSMMIEPQSPGKGSVFITTDKPIYQPGQVVHVRALAMAGDQPIADRPTEIVVRTPDGTKVFKQSSRTSAFGVASFDFALAEQVKLGSYPITFTMTVSDQDSAPVTGSRAFMVKRYSLPKLQVSLEDVNPVVSKDPVRGVARARWVFGEPVKEGAMTVELQRDGAVVGRARGQVDKEGAFRFSLLPQPGPGGASTLSLRANVEVEGGMSAEATKSLSMLGAAQIKLEAFPEGGELAAEVEQDVVVVATYPSPGGITLKVQPEGPATKTSERGIGTLRFRPERGRPVTISARAPDGSTGDIKLESSLGRVVVRPDRTAYEAGASAKVKVIGGEVGDRVAVRMTKSGEPIASGTCVVRAFDEGCEASLAIPAGTSGLVWTHALTMPGDVTPPPGPELSKFGGPSRGDSRVRVGKRLVVVRGGSRDLALEIKPDKPIHAPREQGQLDVAVTGSGGAPVKAQLGVTVADEAVFALADVRPDLEKKFFTIDQDLAGARGDAARSYASGRSWTVPTEGAGPYEATTVYDASSADDVRGAVLAALTQMPESGKIDGSSALDCERRAQAAIEIEQTKAGGRAILLLLFMSMLAFAGFIAYGVTRYREPLLLAKDDDPEANDVLRRETRGLFFDWLLAILAPPLFVSLGAAFADVVLDARTGNEQLLLGMWVAIATLSTIAVVRSVLRVRSLPMLADAPLSRRALFLLPVATLLGHVAAVLLMHDGGHRLDEILPLTRDAALLGVGLALCVQLAFGFFSVVRQGMLRPIARTRTKAWLLLSRASFLGLPVSLALLVVVLAARAKAIRSIAWDDYVLARREVEVEPTAYADNKEGGSGARAKAEEGSMGAPRAASEARRHELWGPSSRGADGNAPRGVVRDWFPETLLWAPEVITDDAGHAKVQVPFADSITTWRLGLTAVSKTGQLGSATLPLVVKQDFFVEAALPPVLTQGDEVAVPVTVHGYTEGEQDVTVELGGEGIAAVGEASVALHLGKNEARGARFVLRADKAGDRVVRIRATSASRADVVERKLRIVPNGLEVVRSQNGRVQGSATVETVLPANAIDGSNDLSIKIYGGPLSQLAEGLDGVFTMPHGCFEQTSSVTYPSVLALDFLLRSKAASPEIEKKARGTINDGYQRLVAFEVAGGGFSLFGTQPASPTLTAYGLLELADMSRVATVDETLIARTRDWLFTRRSRSGGYRRHERDEADDPSVTAFVAWALASYGADKPRDPRLEALLDLVEKADHPRAADPYSLALRANALLAAGRAEQARAILDQLASAAQRGEGGAHWSSKESGVMYAYGPSLDVEVTGLSTHALALAKRDADLRAAALDWLVARRGPHGTWSTTQATIAAMRALLDEAKPAPNDPQLVTVLVDGEKVDAYTLEPKNRDVHHLVDLRRFASTGTHAIEVRGSGQGDVSYQLVTSHWLPWQRPPPERLALDVKYAPEATAVGSTTTCRARLAWTGAEPAEVPIVEIAVPPAFEVDPGDLDALVARSSVLRRWTMEHGKVTLYLESLAPSQPLDVSFPLRALRTARVVAPSSSAYLYYHPEVRAETAPVVMRAR